jgi:hypothetical protein
MNATSGRHGLFSNCARAAKAQTVAMPMDPDSWRNRSTGDLDREFPEAFAADVEGLRK